MKTTLLGLGLATALAASLHAQQAAPEVAARIGDRVVTVQELDQAWRLFDASGKAQADQAIYDGRKAALDRMVASTLLQQAAAAKGVPMEKFVAEEVAKRKKPVTPADVDAFYNANQQQMQGNPIEKMRGTIRGFLEQQQENEANEALIADLRKGGPAVRVSIDPPRQPVQLAPYNAVRGPAAAPVTIVEFSDYQCPFCSRVTPTLKRLRDTYGDRVRIVWKDFPLPDLHPNAFKASEAAHCAGEQGKYWEFHDRMFGDQGALGLEALKQSAVTLGLEPGGFNACLDSSRHAPRVREGMDEGRTLGVDSTPTLFINGRRVTGAQPYEVFTAIIDDELERAKTP